jgi:hypothetical protein
MYGQLVLYVINIIHLVDETLSLLIPKLEKNS